MAALSPRSTDAPSTSWTWPAILAVVVFAIFAPALRGDFLVWDDRTHLHDNPHLWPPESRDLAYFWRSSHWGMYVPIAYTFWGGLGIVCEKLSPGDPQLSPVLFHAANVGLHVLATLLVYRILRRLGAVAVGAFVGALLFAMHPLQVEAVAWISEARGLLAAVFGLAAVDQFLAIADGRGAKFRYAAASLLFVAALLSKSSAAVIPLFIGILAVVSGRFERRRILLLLSPWCIAAAAVLWFTHKQQTDAPNVDAGAWWQRPLVAVDALAFYVGKLFKPWPLLFDYERTPARVLAGRGVWAAAMLVVVLTVLLWRPALRRIGFTAWLLFIAGLLPVLGLLPFSFQALSTVADRYVYLATLGPAWAAAMIVSSEARHLRAVSFATIAVLVTCAAITEIQLDYWRDDVRLCTHELAYRPDNEAARRNLGAHYELAGDATEAAYWYGEALKIDPDDRDALIGLGNTSIAAGDAAAAVRHFEHAARVRPNDDEIRTNLGTALAMTGRYGEAEAQFRKAVDSAATPRPELLVNLGRTLAAQGRPADAEREFRRALEADPNYRLALDELARLRQ